MKSVALLGGVIRDRETTKMLKSAIGSLGWKRQWVLALGFLVSTGASAAGIFMTNPWPAVMTDTTVGWVIGSDAQIGGDPDLGPFRVEVTGGPWAKQLSNTSGDPLDSDTGPINMIEFLRLKKDLDLKTWTEAIVPTAGFPLPTGWKWDLGNDPTLNIQVFADGGNIDYLICPAVSACSGGDSTFTLDGSGTILMFNFDLAFDDANGANLTNGAVDFWAFSDAYVSFDINKALICTLAAEEDCTNNFTVLENPAPEPGTLLLLAGGLAGLAGLRRRRYA